jgi:hypothetical protein
MRSMAMPILSHQTESLERLNKALGLLSDLQLTFMGSGCSIASSIGMTLSRHASKIIADHRTQEPKSGRQDFFKVCKLIRPCFDGVLAEFGRLDAEIDQRWCRPRAPETGKRIGQR